MKILNSSRVSGRFGKVLYVVHTSYHLDGFSLLSLLCVKINQPDRSTHSHISILFCFDRGWLDEDRACKRTAQRMSVVILSSSLLMFMRYAMLTPICSVVVIFVRCCECIIVYWLTFLVLTALVCSVLSHRDLSELRQPTQIRCLLVIFTC